MTCSIKERNQNETAFFSSNGAYRQLDCGFYGIERLCTRLSRLLYEHLTRELPKLQAEINQKHKDNLSELALLGEARETLKDQKRYLISLAQDFHTLTKAAVDGYVIILECTKESHLHLTEITTVNSSVIWMG